MLVLEGAQAGLSWLTILKKRGGYRRAFDGFDPEKVARYGERKVEELLADPGIVRNRRKVDATVRNARSFLAVREEFGTFDRYLWGFVGGEPAHNRWQTTEEVPAETEASRVLSRDLKRRGFGSARPSRHPVVDGLAGTIGAWEPTVPGVDCYEQHRFGGGESWKR
jgi:DNA-3-methyladenine glycosylase I